VNTVMNLHKMLGSSWGGTQLAASQEGLSSMSEWETKWQLNVPLQVSSPKERRKLEHGCVREGTVMLFVFQLTILESKEIRDMSSRKWTVRALSHITANKDGEYWRQKPNGPRKHNGISASFMWLKNSWRPQMRKNHWPKQRHFGRALVYSAHIWDVHISVDSHNNSYSKFSILRRREANLTLWLGPTQQPYCLEGGFTAPLPSNGSYSIVGCIFVAAGMCLPSRCLVTNVYSNVTIPAFGRHVTIYGHIKISASYEKVKIIIILQFLYICCSCCNSCCVMLNVVFSYSVFGYW
jgi:hypothetical protein